MLHHVRASCAIDNSCPVGRDLPLWQDAYRCQEDNDFPILAISHSLSIMALHLEGNRSITDAIGALAHDNGGLLKLLEWRESADRDHQG